MSAAQARLLSNSCLSDLMRWWNRIVVSGQTFEVKRDCFVDVRGGFRSGLTLRDATGKGWDLRDKILRPHPAQLTRGT